MNQSLIFTTAQSQTLDQLNLAELFNQSVSSLLKPATGVIIMADSTGSSNPTPSALKSSFRRAKSVRFSEMSQMLILEPKYHRNSTYYSSREMALFRVQAMRDAQLLSRVIYALHYEGIAVGDKVKEQCLGIEKLLYSNTSRRLLLEQRRNHIRKMISAQNKCTAAKLRCVSEESSRQSSARDLTKNGAS